MDNLLAATQNGRTALLQAQTIMPPEPEISSETVPGQVTELLVEMRGGNRQALEALLPLVYEELRSLAHQKLRFERSGHTLNTTALVHEAYLRLVDQSRVEWRNRSHFIAVAAQAMRRILINYAEMRTAAKRGGGAVPVALDEAAHVLSVDQAEELVALDHALQRLETFNERGCRVIEYHFFGGLTFEEISEVMGISTVTARRAWTAARSWLRRELSDAQPPLGDRS